MREGERKGEEGREREGRGEGWERKGRGRATG